MNYLLSIMGELEEFAEALFAQLSVEINEEKEIADLASKIHEDTSFNVKFEYLEQICEEIFPQMAQKVNEFIGIQISPKVKIEYPKLNDFKKMKGKKVFANDEARLFVDELFDAVSQESLEKIVTLLKKRYDKISCIFYIRKGIHFKYFNNLWGLSRFYHIPKQIHSIKLSSNNFIQTRPSI